MYSIFRTELHDSGLRYLARLREYLAGKIEHEELGRMQYQQLCETVKYARNGSAFYRERLSHISETPAIGEIQSLLNKIPFTTKSDLAAAGNDMSSDILGNAWIYYETTGTTGPSTPCPRNEIDSLVNNSFLTLQYERILNTGGKHVIGVMGPTELHSTGDTFEDVCRSLGHTVVKMWPRSPLVGMQRVLRLVRELHITALVCTPAVASELLKYCRANACEPTEMGIEVILVLGELITPARLRNLARNWGAKMYNCMYASQETSILAACDHTNKLTTIPLNNFYELISPFTDQALQVGTDVIAGELVITHLYQGNKPLLRYRTGDMVRCKRIDLNRWEIEPIGRVKDVLTLNGRTVYAFDIENAVFEELEYCYEYFVEINNQAGTDTVDITLESCDELTDPVLLQRLAAKLVSLLGGPAHIHVGDVGELIGTAAMVSWKAARINDRREGANNSERNAALAILQNRKRA
ncbi:MAG: phenylacetate--CoA ligase family protein [Pseudomonadota bacterium]